MKKGRVGLPAAPSFTTVPGVVTVSVALVALYVVHVGSSVTTS